MRALLSVYDKEGLVELAQGLSDLGWELVASGNTVGRAERGRHRPHRGGRGHRLARDARAAGSRRSTPRSTAASWPTGPSPSTWPTSRPTGSTPSTWWCRNLYPFSSDPSIELIDVGGPTMVRAAAKNHAHVGIVTSPADYPVVLEELRALGHALGGDPPPAGPGRLRPHRRLRRRHRRLARRRGARTGRRPRRCHRRRRRGGRAARAVLPPTLHLTLERAEVLRYGENPHQRGARYRTAGTAELVGRHGPARRATPLSYLNLFDADAAWRLVHELAADAGAGQPAVAIIKHANPCGAAVAADLVTAYERALECDVQSRPSGAWSPSGGDVTDRGGRGHRRRPAGRRHHRRVLRAEALEKLTGRRKATRLLSGPAPEPAVRQLRSLGTSVLVQDADAFVSPRCEWRAVTKRAARPRTSGATWCWPGGSAAARPPTPSPSSPTARPSGSAPGSSPGSWRPRSRCTRPASGPRAGRGRATPSSPSPTGCCAGRRRRHGGGPARRLGPGRRGDRGGRRGGLAMVMTGERHFRH